MSQLDISEILEQEFSKDALRRAAQSENTRFAYQKGWQYFVSWCQRMGLEPLEARSDDIVGFLIAMACQQRPGGGKPLALNTLKLFRSALNNRWQRMGLPSPAADRSVNEVLQGLKRMLGSKPRRVKAIREYQLLPMLNLCGGSLHGLRDAALLSLGFAAALRRSELCSLRTDDLQRKGTEQMIVTVQRSKTDLHGVGQNVAVIEGESIRPIMHLERWLQASGISEGFVFQTLLRGGVASGRPLDSGDVARVVKRYTQKVGLEPSEYSGHSLRAGFVTSAAVHNARIDKIMEITRHRNAETVLMYIRDEQSFVDHAGSSFL
ncbi:MAG: tyrosine-type recombinase/integrase [Gammaproteobacteria bacterium]|nr:tyrosine-type recombinase/integrase [Gammaproteobacteria bacterium]